MTDNVKQELQDATERILKSDGRKKLVVAGPGTGKTFLFKKLLESAPGDRTRRLVLTFLNNLRDDLDRSLGDLAQTFTLHGYCQHLLRQHAELRGGLSAAFKCYPGLVSLIKKDWSWLCDSQAPKFIQAMRDLNCSEDEEAFYLARANYYDAVDFDDSVYRTYRQLNENAAILRRYELVLIDEFQDFNRMEAGIIDLLAVHNSIVIAGDDDQALYSQLRSASWDYIRAHYRSGDYEVFELPFCMRCTEVIIGAVNDVLKKANVLAKLDGRIDKPYRFYEPQKGEDSRRYPKIDLVTTSVQRRNANYFGKYIEKAINEISEADIKTANEDQEPVALVIGSDPYRRMVKEHLIEVGLLVPDEQDDQSEREKALEIIHARPESNLGWRIFLACGDEAIAAERIRAANEKRLPLCEVIPDDERSAALEEARIAVGRHENEQMAANPPDDMMNIKVTSYEGSKGLSSQHVFLIGLHAGDFPRDAGQITDIEICKFLVGLTRTRKKCTLIHTRRFGEGFKTPSPFLAWIARERYMSIRVDRRYWDES